MWVTTSSLSSGAPSSSNQRSMSCVEVGSLQYGSARTYDEKTHTTRAERQQDLSFTGCEG